MRPGNRTSARAAVGVAAAFKLAAPLHQLSRVPERCAQVLERARTTSGHLQLGMLAIASMAASECAASSASSGPPQAAPARAFPCGSAITGHIASSSPHDQIHPSISTVSCGERNITVSYAISSPYRDEGIPVPFGPTPPTALLIDAGKIVASQVTQPQAIPSAPSTARTRSSPMLANSISTRPDVHRAMPGDDLAADRQDPAQYQMAVVMSRQPQSDESASESASPKPSALTIATAPLPPG